MRKKAFTSPRSRRFTRADRTELEEYVRYYTERGVIGMWTEHARAINAALREIDRLRTKQGKP